MVNLKIYVMQQSKAALRGLVCALKGIQESDVKNIEVLNPINLNSAGKETIMDLKLTLNNNEVLNIELQVYPDKHWIRRSILYLGRTYDSIGLGENYDIPYIKMKDVWLWMSECVLRAIISGIYVDR